MFHPKFCEVEDFMDSVRGCRIEGGERGEDGFHFFLDDGRVLVVSGIADIYVGFTKEETIQ